MTRVLVVHHDVDVADIEVDALRRAGYEVDQCAGPIGSSCPVLNGEPCWQVEKADVLVYDMWAAGDESRELVDELREFHPGKPVVLTSPGFVLDWVDSEDTGETPVLGAPNRSELVTAIEAAVARKASGGGKGEPKEHKHHDAAPRREMPRW